MLNNLNYIDNGVYRFRISFQNDDGNYYSYYFDAIQSENVIMQSNITEHPTTKGINIADNTYPNPIEINASVLISYLDTGKRYSGDYFTWFGDRTNAINSLRSLKDNGIVCTVYTKHNIYENMVIQNISTNNSGKEQLNLPLSLSFKEVRFANYTGYIVTEEEAIYNDTSTTDSDTQILSQSTLQGIVILMGAIVGGIIGSFIPIPGVGTAIGTALGAIVGSLVFYGFSELYYSLF